MQNSWPDGASALPWVLATNSQRQHWTENRVVVTAHHQPVNTMSHDEQKHNATNMFVKTVFPETLINKFQNLFRKKAFIKATNII